MNLIERVKNILLAPKTEWSVIEAENDPHAGVLKNYLIWLALIPAAAGVIGYGLIGYEIFGVKIGGDISSGIRYAVQQYVGIIAGAYLSALVIDMLASNFGATRNFDRAFQLTAYSYTAVCVGGIFYILPSLSILAVLAGLYSLYLLYLGIKPMMKVPDDKATTYFVVALIVMIVVSFAISAILGVIIGVKAMAG